MFSLCGISTDPFGAQKHIKNSSIKNFGAKTPPPPIPYVWDFPKFWRGKEALNIKNVGVQGVLEGGPWGKFLVKFFMLMPFFWA